MHQENVLAKKRLDGFWMVEPGTRYLFHYHNSISSMLIKPKAILSEKSGSAAQIF